MYNEMKTGLPHDSEFEHQSLMYAFNKETPIIDNKVKRDLSLGFIENLTFVFIKNMFG